MLSLDGVFRQSLVGVGIGDVEYLLDASDPNLAIPVAQEPHYSILHVMIGRYIESLSPVPETFSLFRMYVEKFRSDSVKLATPPTGCHVLRDELAGDGSRYAVSYDMLTVNPLFDDRRLLGLVTAGHASLRRPAHRLTIEHHIYRLHMPWIPHPWFGQDENEEARWVPRGAAQRKQCLQ